MNWLSVDSIDHCLELTDDVVANVAVSLRLPPGSYAVRICSASPSKPHEATAMLWLLHGRHIDRATGIATHSRMRSLAGMDDVFLVDILEETMLYAFLFNTENFLHDRITVSVESNTSTQEMIIRRSINTVSFPKERARQEAASINLEPGTHTIRVDSGTFSFFSDLKDAEPIALVYIGGGAFLEQGTQRRVGELCCTLNGYGASLVITVEAATVLHAFNFDSNRWDNSGQYTLAISDLPRKNAPYRALLIDGQSEHRDWNGTEPNQMLTDGMWREVSRSLRCLLQETGLFRVDVFRAAPFEPPRSFNPNFGDYDVVILNYSSQVRGSTQDRHSDRDWPKPVKAAFHEYVQDGGGLVVFHSSNNSFPLWPEYNRMTGLGGWYGRDVSSGPLMYFDKAGILHREEAASEHPPTGDHPSPKAFPIIIRDSQHPITNGLPVSWMHNVDELYQKLRGPAENINILATAYSDPLLWPQDKTTDRHEPVLMTISYGKGRIFHTTLGHADRTHRLSSVECVGFITTFQRGAEWAACGKVTQTVPDDFPDATTIRTRELN